MSKIFEALSKTAGDVADLALPMMAAQPTVTATPDPARDAGPIAEMYAADGAVADGSVASPETLDAATWAQPPVHEMGGNSTGRTASLHLALESPVLPFDEGSPYAGEQYRLARTKIIQHPAQPRMITISSAGSGDGKTVSSINIAGALALKSEARVLLVDADLRRSQIATLLGIPQSPGLSDVLTGICSHEEAIVQLEQFPNLFVMPGGKPQANPTELLDSRRWESLCSWARQEFGFVIFDAPPMATVADYDLIQAHCDGVIMVVRPDHTDRKLCLQALETIPKARLVGVLLNCVRDWFLWKTRDYYYPER